MVPPYLLAVLSSALWFVFVNHYDEFFEKLQISY